jgi:hypothetical protein
MKLHRKHSDKIKLESCFFKGKMMQFLIGREIELQILRSSAKYITPPHC